MLPFCTYDVFTTQHYAGNPLAIVEGAGHLTTHQMQTIAREFNLSETMFVMPPRDAAHDAKVRIFFPTAEIPFAGHPTLGCAVHLAERAYGPGDFEAQIILEEEAGLVPVDVTRRDGVTEGWFTAPVVPHAADGEVDTDLAARALGIARDKIGFGSHLPGVWQGGPSFAYLPIADRETLAQIKPIEPHWSALVEGAGDTGIYMYTAGVDGIDYEARMMAPHHGIAEDPATGSATAILAAQLLANGAIGEGNTALTLCQGRDMGRKSDLGLRIDVAGGAIEQVRVGGNAVPFSQGHLRPPAA